MRGSMLRLQKARLFERGRGRSRRPVRELDISFGEYLRTIQQLDADDFEWGLIEVIEADDGYDTV